MDGKQSSQNYFVPGWLNELLDGHLSSKLPPGRSHSHTAEHALFCENEHLKKNNIRNEYKDDTRGSMSNGKSFSQMTTPHNSTTLSGKRFSIQYGKHPDAELRHAKQFSAVMVENNCSRKDAFTEPQKEKANGASDEDFPSLLGERTNEVNRTTACKSSSVWDNSRESPYSGCVLIAEQESIKKVSPLQTVVANRINPAKPLSEQNKISSNETFGGSRKMTILSCGNGRQKHAPVISVSKVVTRELEARKSSYMKLVRRESRETNRTESCSENSSSVMCNEQRALKTWAAVVQNSVDSDSDMTTSGSCTPCDGRNFTYTCENPPETMDFNSEDERKLLNEMGWDENDESEELSLEEINKFLESYPDFSKHWDLLIDNNSGESDLVKFTLQKRQPSW